jgi:hypothetical protein
MALDLPIVLEIPDEGGRRGQMVGTGKDLSSI